MTYEMNQWHFNVTERRNQSESIVIGGTFCTDLGIEMSGNGLYSESDPDEMITLPTYELL